TAGLAALVQHTGCKVVAPKAGLDVVQSTCPAGTKILTEEDLEKKGWFEVRALPLGGRGRAPLAHKVRWAHKTVLFSGHIPVKHGIRGTANLLREVAGPGGTPGGSLKSLGDLKGVRPALWLPAVPVHGQNANLYGRDWEEVLEQNRSLFLR